LDLLAPEGAGKTTYLSKQVAHAAEKYGPDKVLVTSFTRAAAAELVGRDLPIGRNQIGTLHAHCYRALGAPELAEKKEHLAEWNKSYPNWALSGGGNLDEAAVDRKCESPGDELFGHYQSLRARMVRREI
jgi:superfamily I DNA/RNA helicase